MIGIKLVLQRAESKKGFIPPAVIFLSLAILFIITPFLSCREADETPIAGDKTISGEGTGPEGIVLITFVSDGNNLLKDLRDYIVAGGFPKPKLFGVDGNKDKDISGGPAADLIKENMWGTAPTPPKQDPDYGKFVQMYRKKWGAPPAIFNDNAYDAVYIIAMGIESAGEYNPEKVKEKLVELTNGGEEVKPVSAGGSWSDIVKKIKAGTDIDYKGVSGKLDFAQNGDVKSGVYVIWKITDTKGEESDFTEIMTVPVGLEEDENKISESNSPDARIDKNQVPQGSQIKVGAIIPLTGELAGFGKTFEKALKLAVDEINSEGGVLGNQIELSTCDDGTTPEGAKRCFDKLTEEGIKFIIGPATSSGVINGVCDGARNKVCTPVKEKKILIISPSATSPLISELDDGGFIWRTPPSDAFQGKALADYIIEEHKLTSVAVIFRNDPYGRGLASAFKSRFEELGGKITAFVSYPEGKEKDFIEEINKIYSSNQ